MLVAKVQPFHLRPAGLSHEFKDEFVRAAWGPDFGLGEASAAAGPVCALWDRKAVRGKGNV